MFATARRASLILARPTSRSFQTTVRRTFNSQQANRSVKALEVEQSQVLAVHAFRNQQRSGSNYYWLWAAAAGCFFVAPMKIWHAKTANFKQVRQDIEDILDDPDYDDGSFGPVLIRLAWHSSGTYSAFDKNGGSNGANMRHAPEKDHGANAGLDVAREKLESIKKKHPEISYADLYILASIVAIEAMGGPKISFRPGRTDTKDNKLCTPDGRLPDASKGRDHIRAIFYRMGLNDEEMVALIGGGHAIGRCHTDRSGFSGPWTNSPTMFTNDFFVQLLENEWSEKKWDGPTQYEDKSGELMMLPTDLELRDDPIFRKHSEKFAEDEDYFFEVFAKAYEKLVNMGCDDILCPRAV